jgi:hypothetical protein
LSQPSVNAHGGRSSTSPSHLICDRRQCLSCGEINWLTLAKETGDDAIIIIDALLKHQKGFKHAVQASLYAAEELIRAGLTATFGLLRENDPWRKSFEVELSKKYKYLSGSCVVAYFRKASCVLMLGGHTQELAFSLRTNTPALTALKDRFASSSLSSFTLLGAR